MSGFDADRVVLRAAGQGDAGRLSLIANATFLETFAGEIAGDALVRHCEVTHDPAYLATRLAGGTRAWW